MIEKAKRTIDGHKMLSRGDTVLVGVSGGPDSMALLHLLLDLRDEYGITLMLAHLNHGFRKEAEEEAEFVRNAAVSLNLPSVIKFVDVPAVMERDGLSAQEAAREARYAFFEEAAVESSANKVALAHNADDQAETVLMRLLRGAGSLGLSGIPPVRKIRSWGPVIIRPVIDCSRREIEGYLSERGIPFVTDNSNLKKDYTRNRVRMELIPFLEGYNPNIKDSLSRTAHLAHQDNQFLAMEADKAYEEVLSHKSAVGSQDISMDYKSLMGLHPAISSRVILNAIKRVKGDLRRISFRHISDMLRLLESGEGRWSLHLPGVTVDREHDKILFRVGKGRR